MKARKWEFEPSTIRVKKGDKVKLKIESVDVAHGFKISELGINKELKPGQITVVEFTADKIGEFEFFCSVFCGTGHKDMVGKLVVE